MKLFSTVVILMLVGACATTPPAIPLELQYVIPPGTLEMLAVIKGSQEDSSSVDGQRVFVLAVDGRRVTEEEQGWNSLLPILPGSHNVTVAFRRGIFFTQVELPLVAMSGSQYEVRFVSDLQLYRRGTYHCDFWIVDMSTQKSVTEMQRGFINGN